MEEATDETLTRRELLEIIYDYLDADDIEMCSEEISLRDLRDILTKKFSRLNTAKKKLSNGDFLCNLNALFCRKCFESVVGVFSDEELMSFGLKTNAGIFSIGPLYRRYGEGEHFYYKSDGCLIDNGTIKLITKNSKKIEAVFDALELLRGLPLSFHFNVKDDIFSGYIGYYNYEKPEASIDLDYSVVPKQIATREYVDSPAPIRVLERNMESLLGKIPVSVDELPLSVQGLIGEELEKREAQKLKRDF